VSTSRSSTHTRNEPLLTRVSTSTRRAAVALDDDRGEGVGVARGVVCGCADRVGDGKGVARGDGEGVISGVAVGVGVTSGVAIGVSVMMGRSATEGEGDSCGGGVGDGEGGSEPAGTEATVGNGHDSAALVGVPGANRSTLSHGVTAVRNAFKAGSSSKASAPSVTARQSQRKRRRVDPVPRERPGRSVAVCCAGEPELRASREKTVSPPRAGICQAPRWRGGRPSRTSSASSASV
jgi:hypothetical protein